MKVADIQTITFKYKSRIVRDIEGHSHPGSEHEERMNLTKIVTTDGMEGYCFGGSREANDLAKRMIVGEDPLDRERIWQRLRCSQRIYRQILTDYAVSVIDMALWDLAGRYFKRPVYKLLGGFRDKVPAYASTMCGDDIVGGLNSPEAYADFAEECKKRGYTAFKLHTWMPPFKPDPKRDIEACRAVRERVGDEMRLMLDCHHNYSRIEALYIGRELEKLGFYWFEEPMNEYSMSSYKWLADQLDIPIVGPETVEGKMYSRAEWILSGASDISRCSVYHGGITGLIKAVHLCESFGVRLEVHGGGAGNLQVLGAMGIPGEYYERGLLHPLLDYEDRTPWLKKIIDPMDSRGYVKIPQKPGLGYEIDWSFIEENKVEDT